MFKLVLLSKETTDKIPWKLNYKQFFWNIIYFFVKSERLNVYLVYKAFIVAEISAYKRNRNTQEKNHIKGIN